MVTRPEFTDAMKGAMSRVSDLDHAKRNDETKAALVSLTRALEAAARTTALTGVRHDYRIPSQMQAKIATTVLADWARGGANGPLPLSESELRAGVYDLTRVAAQTAALPVVSSVAVAQLLNGALGAINSGSLLVLMTSLRSIMERVALAHWVAAKTADFRARETREFGDLMDIADVITRSVYGTAVSWIALAGQDIRSMARDELGYRRDENSANMERIQILSAIDKLSKAVVGARTAYEILCEFLHPNIGDLLSSTEAAVSQTDARGTRFIVRTLGGSDLLLTGNPDVQGVMVQVWGLMGDILDEYARALDLLSTNGRLALRVTRRTAHLAVRKNRHLFGRADLCPCNSGKLVRHCAVVL